MQYVKDQMKDPVQVVENYYDITKKEVTFHCINSMHVHVCI